MALTISFVTRHVPKRGGLRWGLVDLTFDNSYPTGGEAVSATDLKLNNLEFLCVPNLAGFVLSWDRTNGKIKAFESGTADGALTELNDTSNLLDGLVARCLYMGS